MMQSAPFDQTKKKDVIQDVNYRIGEDEEAKGIVLQQQKLPWEGTNIRSQSKLKFIVYCCYMNCC
ncbi:hypothetical protein HanXRQr2_Chr11g0470301 [Helianthus annuus]|uniref:Uncharacterized protein n=1 Tax=Helianthus annuus TaxID=4232 RepID=A0A9K3HLA4_HELAN|nr:hypothetical protein HanXRQr2_Chr11g0470301 [Helianthus annuus]